MRDLRDGSGVKAPALPAPGFEGLRLNLGPHIWI